MKVSAAVKLWVKSAVFNAIYLLCVFVIQLSVCLFVCLVRRQPHGFLTLSMERYLLLGKGDVCGIFLGELKWAIHLYVCTYTDSLDV